MEELRFINENVRCAIEIEVFFNGILQGTIFKRGWQCVEYIFEPARGSLLEAVVEDYCFTPNSCDQFGYYGTYYQKNGEECSIRYWDGREYPVMEAPKAKNIIKTLTAIMQFPLEYRIKRSYHVSVGTCLEDGYICTSGWKYFPTMAKAKRYIRFQRALLRNKKRLYVGEKVF